MLLASSESGGQDLRKIFRMSQTQGAAAGGRPRGRSRDVSDGLIGAGARVLPGDHIHVLFIGNSKCAK